jgi:hypothetical protein
MIGYVYGDPLAREVCVSGRLLLASRPLRDTLLGAAWLDSHWQPVSISTGHCRLPLPDQPVQH